MHLSELFRLSVPMRDIAQGAADADPLSCVEEEQEVVVVCFSRGGAAQESGG